MGKRQLKPGLYEKVINEGLAQELSDIEKERKSTKEVDSAEASRVLSQYIQEVVQKKLDAAEEKGGIKEQVRLTNEIVRLLEDQNGSAKEDENPVEEKLEIPVLASGKQDTEAAPQTLQVLLPEHDPLLAVGKSAEDYPRPMTSIARSSLFTGAAHEPSLDRELEVEIPSCRRIDLLVAFIRWSGLRLILPELRKFTEGGGSLRVITTTYTGATDSKAVEELASLPNTEVRICYDTQSTRMHAKTYIFIRDTGYSTAYIGSSNLSRAAITKGLEWNVKITEADQPDTMRKVQASFDSYWHDERFEQYHAGSEEDEKRLRDALEYDRSGGKGKISSASGNNCQAIFTIRPYAFQQQILDALQAERVLRHHNHNLIVAATGTGKTVIAAFDYKEFCRTHKVHRLLFVAHREELLLQAQGTFQGILQDPNFGQILDGTHTPDSPDELFATIQSINSQKLWDRLKPDYYQYIVVDEYHHAAAASYQKLLGYFNPEILLGLTATPERMDGKSILDLFDGQYAAEIRLPEAIDRGLLCSFQYFGVTDTVDLDKFRWVRGGYEVSDLNNVYVYNREVAERRAGQIILSIQKYVADVNEMKALGFCVSVEHATFMAKFFNEHSIPAEALYGGSDDATRNSAKERLQKGEIKIIFVVDLYNEGVDIPEINTVLFLRPTQSLTIFLQQLGRGLRICKGKDCLTVLDYIGQANKKYNFEEKFAALLEKTRRNVRDEIKRGFTSLPNDCYIRLEEKAKQHILDNISKNFDSKPGLISRIQTFEADSGKKPTLVNFLDYYRLDPHVIYVRKASFARLCVQAKVREDFSEPAEDALTKALVHLADLDSRDWIRFLQENLGGILDLAADGSTDMLGTLSDREQRMLQMFYITVFGSYAESWQNPKVLENLRSLWQSPVMMQELQDLLAYRYAKIDFVDQPVNLDFDCPLGAYCTYTRDQLFTALDYKKPGDLREGVKWLPDKKIDVLLVTLNKSENDYSPSTMYNDYSMSQWLFHWQSQSTTSENSKTGQRYIHHDEEGSRVLLFVRESKKGQWGEAMPYTFLGTVHYQSHEGSRPMTIIWKLDHPIPAKYITKTNQLEVG